MKQFLVMNEWVSEKTSAELVIGRLNKVPIVLLFVISEEQKKLIYRQLLSKVALWLETLLQCKSRIDVASLSRSVAVLHAV